GPARLGGKGEGPEVQQGGGGPGWVAGEDAVPGVHRQEQVGERANRLGGAQQQEAARIQPVVQHGQHALLQGHVEIDQDVPATDQVEPGEGRIDGQVVPGEDAQIAHRLADLVVAIDLGEEAAQPVGGDVQLDVVHVDAGAGLFQGGLVDVGGQDLD